jgi:hypothetical protein
MGTTGGGGEFFAAGSTSRSSELRASQAEPRASFPVFFQHQAEPRLGSTFPSLTEPSHEPARLGSIPPLDWRTKKRC